MKRIKVLFVCMGNICRSPLAEGIFAHLASQSGLAGQYAADSAGIGSWHTGDRPDPRSIATAYAHGIDISAQRARQISQRDFDVFDMIVAMDKANIAALRKLSPRAQNIHLFGDLALGTGEDIPDPYYGGPEGFELVYTRLFTGCSRLLETPCVE